MIISFVVFTFSYILTTLNPESKLVVLNSQFSKLKELTDV